MNHQERNVIRRAHSRLKAHRDERLHAVEDSEVRLDDSPAVAHAEEVRAEACADGGPPVRPDVSRMPPADLEKRVLPGDQHDLPG